MMQTDEPTRTDDPDDESGPMISADPAEVEALTRQVLEGLGLDVKVTVKDAGETIEVDVDGADRVLPVGRRVQGRVPNSQPFTKPLRRRGAVGLIRPSLRPASGAWG